MKRFLLCALCALILLGTVMIVPTTGGGYGGYSYPRYGYGGYGYPSYYSYPSNYSYPSYYSYPNYVLVQPSSYAGQYGSQYGSQYGAVPCYNNGNGHATTDALLLRLLVSQLLSGGLQNSPRLNDSMLQNMPQQPLGAALTPQEIEVLRDLIRQVIQQRQQKLKEPPPKT